jgi:CheY-like chemotaxis protein
VDKKKILLAEPTASVRAMLDGVFTARGLQLTAVGDGDAAMAAFAESQPDLVIADIDLPGTGGLTICEMIKQDPETSRTPVILVADGAVDFDAARAEAACANAFFTKPFTSIPDLVNAVNDLLGHREGSVQPAPSDVDDIEGLYRQSFEEPSVRHDVPITELNYQGNEGERPAGGLAPIEVNDFAPDDIGALRSESFTDGTSNSMPLSDFSLDDETIEVTRPASTPRNIDDPFAAPATADHSETSAVGGNSPIRLTLDQIDPTVIDEIVRRVVERLSDAVVREVAEETVPEITKALLSEALDKDHILER